MYLEEKCSNLAFYCNDASRSADLQHPPPLLCSALNCLTCTIQNGANLENSEQKRVIGCGI